MRTFAAFMDRMKTIVKCLLGLLIGISAGMIVACAFIVMFTDLTLTVFFEKLCSVDLFMLSLSSLGGIVFFAISLPVLVLAHETGHLAGGLLSGYKFVSFRIFRFTIIKADGRYRLKRFAVSGTGGQCLLMPPDRPLKRIPVVLYNSGGVIANVLILFAFMPLLWIDGGAFLYEFVVIFLFTDVIIILMNGVPMNVGNVGNDGYNALLLRRSEASKRGIVTQLRVNAMIQNGVRPKDMPAEWFVVADDFDYGNSLELSIPVMAMSRLVDEMKYDEALRGFESLYEHRSEMMRLFAYEIACELVFLRLITGDVSGAKSLYDKDLKKYIDDYRSVMSSKERILCAMALIGEQNRAKAVGIYDDLYARKDSYLLQGEVKSDLALMSSMLDADIERRYR